MHPIAQPHTPSTTKETVEQRRATVIKNGEPRATSGNGNGKQRRQPRQKPRTAAEEPRHELRQPREEPWEELREPRLEPRKPQPKVIRKPQPQKPVIATVIKKQHLPPPIVTGKPQ